MSSPQSEPRTINVDYLARVEGEGSMKVVVRDGEIEHVEFGIFEPPRYFEAFLQGRRFWEAPDITARICGICPAAYQMSACHAIESISDVRPTGAIRELRRRQEEEGLECPIINLPPGDYGLRVRAANPDGIGVSELFTIDPEVERDYFPVRSVVNRVILWIERAARRPVPTASTSSAGPLQMSPPLKMCGMPDCNVWSSVWIVAHMGVPGRASSGCRSNQLP